MNTRYIENDKTTWKLTYEFKGYGMNAEPIYMERITEFSIADGILIENNFRRYVTSDYETYTNYIR